MKNQRASCLTGEKPISHDATIAQNELQPQEYWKIPLHREKRAHQQHYERTNLKATSPVRDE
jgi:hypothetical protein